MNQKLKLALGLAGFALVIVIAVLAYNAFGGQLNRGRFAPEQGGEQQAPDFSMTDADGNSIKLSELIANGKPIVLNFWASWCPPCKAEMPDFEKVYQELGAEVRFMMVNLTDGMQETKEKAETYISGEGYTFPVFFDTKKEGASAYGIRSIPTTFFIDKDGYIVTGVQGSIDESTLLQGIEMIR